MTRNLDYTKIVLSFARTYEGHVTGRACHAIVTFLHRRVLYDGYNGRTRIVVADFLLIDQFTFCAALL